MTLPPLRAEHGSPQEAQFFGIAWKQKSKLEKDLFHKETMKIKHMKRFMALFAALALVLAMAAPAFAAGAVTYTITIQNPVGKYEAYQIFKGRLDGDTLSDVEWGSGITEAGKTALGDAAIKAKALDGKGAADAQAFAKEVSAYLNTASAVASADYTAGASSTTISGLEAGYYLVKNTDNSVEGDNFYTDFIIQVVKDQTVQPKGDKPTLEKQIKHNDGTWDVVGDNQIGDTVKFRTITSVPDTSRYTAYDYTISDKMSDGLTSNVKSSADVVIKVNDEDSKILDTSYYTVSATGNKFEVTVDIINAVRDSVMAKGDKLYTYYTGTLNNNALVYDAGKQDNKAKLTYSNNPNSDSHGETAEKIVYDWTFKMTVKKVNGADTTQELTGAKFVLSTKAGLDLGTIDDNGVPTNKTDLISLKDNADGTYTIAENGTSGTTYVMTAGNIVIKGLDDAKEYYLYETKAPTHFNRLTDPVKVKISANYESDGSTVDNVTISVDDGSADSSMTVLVKNNAGTTLPTTGGIGTTIFYLIGGGLMVAAAVLLIAKKRMENK